MPRSEAEEKRRVGKKPKARPVKPGRQPDPKRFQKGHGKRGGRSGGRSGR